MDVTVRVDYDRDDDGLIEVADLGRLDAIRFDPDGDATVGSGGSPRIPTSALADAYDAAYPDRLHGMGCHGGCIGYELTADLDFDTNGSGAADAGDRFWNDGLGWEPIGGASFLFGQGLFAYYTNDFFHAVFEGNGHAISGLFIDRGASAVGAFSSFNVGLFATVERGGTVRNVRVLGATVVGGERVGTIAGSSAGPVLGVVATGTVKGHVDVGGVVGNVSLFGDAVGGSIHNTHAHADVTGNRMVGGLVGRNEGSVLASYATGDVGGEANVGGLAGLSFGSISASYATGTTTGDENIGGLVALNVGGRIVASYATGAVVAQAFGGGVVGQLLLGTGADVARSYSERHAAGGLAVGLPASSAGSRTTADLLDPSGYDGIYLDWNIDLDGDGEPDDPWSFDAGGYPALKIDADADGEATAREFGPQRGPSRVAVGTSDTDVRRDRRDVGRPAGRG